MPSKNKCFIFRIHALKKTDDLKPFHDRLESMFKTMQAQVNNDLRNLENTVEIVTWADIMYRKSPCFSYFAKGPFWSPKENIVVLRHPFLILGTDFTNPYNSTNDLPCY